MSLIINNNLMAMNTARNLNRTYSRLAKSTERLSSGMRINSSADDAAGLAIRELMRSDLAVMKQGLRNAADGISMIQTAEGAMGVIDEKLTRMKELAEQAATATYTTVQREIINSEYQAMASEIDRIASATHFNGIKLLDGSMNSDHEGRGIKIHFGTGNSASEDYYFIQMGNARASHENGLRIGGDAKNDIWGTVGTNDGANTAGCCGGGISSLTSPVSSWSSGQIFSFGYNWDWKENQDAKLNQGKYIAGAYQVSSGSTLQDLITSVNKGSQGRVRLDFELNSSGKPIAVDDLLNKDSANNAHRICLGDEIYYWGSATLGAISNDSAKTAYSITAANSSQNPVSALATAINSNSDNYWAKIEEDPYTSGKTSLYIFTKVGGNMKHISACDDQLGDIAGDDKYKNQITWFNDEEKTTTSSGTYFNNGGKDWGTMRAIPTGFGSWGVQLNGKNVGKEYDLWILNAGSGNNFDLQTGTAAGGGSKWGLDANNNPVTNMLGLDRNSFIEIQNADDGQWAGAHVRTQIAAQEALAAIQSAIERKDTVRATLGAYQNRLENTMTNLEMMMQSLQAAESRISDVDVATEMTEFVRNQVLAQAAVSMLGQANSLPQMALSLLNG